MTIVFRVRSLLPALILLSVACASSRSRPTPATRLTITRPAGRQDFEFTSRQVSPGGTSRVRIAFTLVTSAAGEETALVTAYEHAAGDAELSAGKIDPSCAPRLTAPSGVVAVLPITPPPRQLGDLIPDCVPEDLFGAASDILPLLMIQMQPAFRAAELRMPGDRLRFHGYETGWRLLPALLDARIVADSGVVSLDSLTPSRAVIGWDTSPMKVDIVRQLAPGQRALLSGQEWFQARVVVDPRNGTLLSAHTTVDSLALSMTMQHPDSMVPAGADAAPNPRRDVVVRRSLELRRLPTGERDGGR